MPRPLPLRTLLPARLQALRGVLTDIDDTLTRDGAIEPAALAALHALADAGVPVVAITGRPAGWSQQLAQSWPLAAMVAENGGVLLTRQTGPGSAWTTRFTVDDATRDAQFQRLATCAQAVLAELPGTLLARDSAGRLTDIAIDHSEFTTLDARRIAQVVALMQSHGLQATVSSIHVNGWIGEHNKWTGAAWAVQQALGLPFEPHDWVYLGDSANDQVMFAQLPLSVAVANIAPCLVQLAEAQALPAYVTQAERGQGFAELAGAVLQARGQAA